MGIPKPADGDEDWGTPWRAAMDIVDSSAAIHGSTPSLNTGISASTFTINQDNGEGITYLMAPVNSIYLGAAVNPSTYSFAGNVCVGTRACLNNRANVSGNIGIGGEANAGNAGSDNIGIGGGALGSAATYDDNNIAIGNAAMNVVSGDTDNNIAIGANTLRSITSYGECTAIGANTLYSNTSGFENHAIGVDALTNNTTGFRNVAVGSQALYYNIGGSANTAIGDQAGAVFQNPVNGAHPQATGNTFIGSLAGTVSSSTIVVSATAIGYTSQVGCSNCVSIGAAPGLGGPISKVGINLSTPTFNLDVYGSSGVYSTGGLTPGSYTAAQILATVPGTVGRLLYCSNCATVPVCVATGTAVNQWALITNRGSACQ